MPKARSIPRDESGPPDADALAAQLGRSHAAFQALIERRPGATCEWKRYSKNAPWVMKVSEGDRTLLYATPLAGRFEVTVVLGERATQAALGGRVRRELHGAIRSARPYVEGRPVRVLVASGADLAGVEELVAVKLVPEPASSVARPSQATRHGRKRT